MFYLKVVHSIEGAVISVSLELLEEFRPDRTSDKMSNVPLVTYYSVKECYANSLFLREKRVGKYAQDMSGLKF